ncbi:thioredoxin family protein [Sulfurimonas sp.]|uniref:thioredoxin family protein n=1 Tax=Sulfurimonas sp. TaxID=2022749 RepID=UPI002B474D1A|nr:thioredoxin fold domain-containing protein [Sulfurimonas sp.]
MKIFITLLLLITFCNAAKIDKFASEVGYFRDYYSALKIAKEQNKPVMLVVVGDYCPWCKKFERKALKSPLIRKRVKQYFIPVVIDNKRDIGKYPKEFHTKLLPTVYFINQNTGEKILRVLGYSRKTTFSNTMDEVIKTYKKKKL